MKAKKLTTKRLEKKSKPPALTIAIDAPSGEGKKMQIRTALSQRAVLEFLADQRGHIGKACTLAGINRDTFYEYMLDPDFKNSVEAVKQGLTDDYIEALNSVALDAKFFPAIKYYLDNHAQDRGFGKDIPQSAKPTPPPVVNIQNNLSTLSPELLKQLKIALAVQAENAGNV